MKIQVYFVTLLFSIFYSQASIAWVARDCVFKPIMSTSDLMCASVSKNLSLATNAFNEYKKYMSEGNTKLANQALQSAREFALSSLDESKKLVASLEKIEPDDIPKNLDKDNLSSFDKSIKSKFKRTISDNMYWISMKEIFDRSARDILDATGGIPDVAKSPSISLDREELANVSNDLKKEGLAESAEFIESIEQEILNIKKDSYANLAKLFQLGETGCNSPFCSAFGELRKRAEEKAGDRKLPPDAVDTVQAIQEVVGASRKVSSVISSRRNGGSFLNILTDVADPADAASKVSSQATKPTDNSASQ